MFALPTCAATNSPHDAPVRASPDRSRICAHRLIVERASHVWGRFIIRSATKLQLVSREQTSSPVADSSVGCPRQAIVLAAGGFPVKTGARRAFIALIPRPRGGQFTPVQSSTCGEIITRHLIRAIDAAAASWTVPHGPGVHMRRWQRSRRQPRAVILTANHRGLELISTEPAIDRDHRAGDVARSR